MSSLKLHKAAWKGDLHRVQRILKKEASKDLVNSLDNHGNSPLHIAAHFNYKEIVEVLLDHGANPELLSRAGWRALEESVATGGREVSTILLSACLASYRDGLTSRREKWSAKLSAMPDFYVELKWEFSVFGTKWLHFFTSFLPNDTYKIYKRGTMLRMDYSLQGFKNFQIQRGNMSFVYTGEEIEPKGHLFVLDHDRCTIQDFCEPPGQQYQEQLKDALDYTYAHDLCSHLPLGIDENLEKHIQFVPKHGFFGMSKHEQTETVNGFKTAVYRTDGAVFRTLIRSDPHAKQTRIPRSLQKEELIEEYKNRYDEYFHPNRVARQRREADSEDDEEESEEDPFYNGLVWSTEKVIRKTKHFDGNIWVTNEFGLTVEQFLTIVGIYSPTNLQWKNLQDFLTNDLPPGYPIKLEVPVFLMLSAVIDFDNYEEESPDASLFEIPEDYEKKQEAFIGSETREMLKVVERNGSKKHEDEKQEDE